MPRILLLSILLASAAWAQAGRQQVFEAYQLFVQGELDKAEQLCMKAIQTPGDHQLSGVNVLYDIWERRRKPAEGMRLFREYFQKTGNYEFLSLGSLRLAESGLNQMAEREIQPLLDRVAKGQSLPPQVTGAMAYAERRLGHLDIALDMSRRAEKDYLAQQSDAWIGMGDLTASLLEDIGRTDEALAQYEFMLQRAPMQPMVLNNYSYYLAVHGREMPKALSLVRRSLALQPNDGPTLDTLGFILLRMNQTEESIDAMVKAYRRLPGETTVRTHLAQALAKRKDRSKTMQELLDVLRTEPNQENTAQIDSLLLSIGE